MVYININLFKNWILNILILYRIKISNRMKRSNKKTVEDEKTSGYEESEP